MRHNRSILTVLQPEQVDYVGFADLRAHQAELRRFGGALVADYRYGVSIGIALPDAIVDFLPQRSDMNVAVEYKTHAYSVINARLDACASKVASFLNRKGCRSLPIVAAERSDAEQAAATVSHKMVAHIAWLGWIGKNCLLITPERGPRVRFATVLTDADLRAVDNPPPQRCGDCAACAKICPAQAIRGRNFVDGESREDRFDFKKCQDYFETLKAASAWEVCGMCLYACPHGRKGRRRG